MLNLEGVYTAIVTPFYSDGRFNEQKLRELIRFQAINGIKGIVPAGTTGENPSFSDKEYLRIYETTCSAAKEMNLQVIAGCGSNNTEKSIILCKKAASFGADAALVITPYYNKPNQEGLFKHFSVIADNSPIPLVLYNVPSRTAVNLLPETVDKLSFHENIIGLKEASGSISQVQDIIFRSGERISILSGEDDLTYSIMALGGKGVIGVSPNIIPDLFNKLVEAMLAGDFETGYKYAVKTNEMCKAMFLDTNPIPVKEAMNILKMEVGPTRMPLTRLSKENYDKLVKTLDNYGLIAK